MTPGRVLDRSLKAWWLAVTLLAAAGCASTSPGRQPFLATTGPVNDFAIPIQSMEDRRFLTVTRQRYDFSCGSAALATLLHYHYDDPQPEAAVFQGMWRDGDQTQIRRVGFSLLDMKHYLGARGLPADGFKVSVEQIAKAGVPGIALLNVRGYRHFVVVKGVTDADLLLGDPSLGLRTMPRAAFERSWNGVYFVINAQTATAKRNFNGDRQWAAFARAPIAGVFAGPLSPQALMLTAPFYRDF